MTTDRVEAAAASLANTKLLRTSLTEQAEAALGAADIAERPVAARLAKELVKTADWIEAACLLLPPGGARISGDVRVAMAREALAEWEATTEVAQ